MKAVTITYKWEDVTRRCLDILVSSLALLLLSPVFLILAFMIKRDTPGPMLYRGKRMGRYGQPFKIYKFRTMYENADSYSGPKITGRADPRITPLGRRLRETKLNELPQFWNVLIGDMSLVGPRPEDPDIVANLPEELRREILSVRPGITSPASIVYVREEEILQGDNLINDYLAQILPHKMRLDQMYIRRRSLLADLDVLLLTASTLAPFLTKTKADENTLYWGPLSRFTSRYLSWFIVDFFTSVMAISLAGVIWRVDTPLNIGILRYLLFIVVLASAFSCTNYLLGVQKVEWRYASYAEVIPLTLSVSFSVALIGVLNLLYSKIFPPADHRAMALPLGVLVLIAILSWIGFVMTRYRRRILGALTVRYSGRRGTPPVVLERVLLVGAGENASFAIWLLTHQLGNRFSITGIVDDDPKKQGMVFSRVPVIGSSADIKELVAKFDIGVIVFTIKRITEQDKKRMLTICHETGCQVVMLPEIMAHVTSQFVVLNEGYLA